MGSTVVIGINRVGCLLDWHWAGTDNGILVVKVAMYLNILCVIVLAEPAGASVVPYRRGFQTTLALIDYNQRVGSSQGRGWRRGPFDVIIGFWYIILRQSALHNGWMAGAMQTAKLNRNRVVGRNEGGTGLG